MVLFVNTTVKSNSVVLEVRGGKCGQISGENTTEVCNKFMRYITKEDVVYVDCRGIGMAVADLLSKVTNVIRLHLTLKDMIKD